MLPKLKECLERRLYEIHDNIIQTLKEPPGSIFWVARRPT